MKTRKQIKLEKAQEKKKKGIKNKLLSYIGIIIFILAVIQVLSLVYWFTLADRTPSNIIMGNQVVTSEVCTNWFNASYKETHTTDKYFYYEQTNYLKDINANHPIPLDIVEKVCDRWQKVKEDLDKNE